MNKINNIYNNTYHKPVKFGIVTFLLLLLLEFIAYFGFFRLIPNFISAYGLWILYLNISIASIGTAIFYVLTNKTRVPCMTGMMIAMTIGMQIGMMIGAVIGATNGFFTGAMVGMILGSIGGVLAGFTSKSTMSWLQGLMAGIMGGTMGPMISVMMFTDRLEVFMPFYIVLNLMVLFGFMKMYHEEAIDGNKELVKKDIDLVTFASACVLITALLLLIMVYGPKAPFFA